MGLTAQDGTQKVNFLKIEYLEGMEEQRMRVQLRGKNGQDWIRTFKGEVQKFVRVRIRATDIIRGCEGKNSNDTHQ